MSWSKGHYERTAEILRNVKHKSKRIDSYTMFEVANSFADFFGYSSPRFDRERFLEAAGYGASRLVSKRRKKKVY